MKFKISLSIFCLALVSLAYSMDEKVEVENPKDMLFRGVRENNIDLITDALDRGANINAVNEYGDTPLITATAICSNRILFLEEEDRNKQNIERLLEPIRIILEAKANPNIQNNKGSTALMKAVERPFTDDLIELLLKSGADINLQNNNGCTALWIATNEKLTSAVKLLLKAGADPNIIADGFNKSTALIVDASVPIYEDKIEEDENLVKILLEYKADPNIQDEHGNTALMLAVDNYNGCNDIIIPLLQTHTDLNILNDQELTVLDIARNKKLDAIELMLLKVDAVEKMILEESAKRRQQIRNTIIEPTSLIHPLANIVADYLYPKANEEIFHV